MLASISSCCRRFSRPCTVAARYTTALTGTGFDADRDLLELLGSGEFSESPHGQYIHSLKSRFEGPVVADLVCYLRPHVELALQAMTRGRYAGRFWILGVGVGMVVPLLLAVVALGVLDDPTSPTGAVLGVLAGLATVVGLYGYEDAFVRAGQAVPLS